MQNKCVSYLRVSTGKQGLNGFGMDAQRAAVRAHLKGDKPQYEFVEVESGRQNQRPELERALACCRKTKSTLVIARLDRLSRNAAFLLNLMDSKVDFVCCDMPHADKFTIQILACVAQKEAELISARTKAGLAAAKRRGVRLGNPRIAKARKLAVNSTKRKAQAFAQALAPVLDEIRHAGVTTLKGIARCLNARGFKTPQGAAFTRQAVAKVQRRLNP